MIKTFIEHRPRYVSGFENKEYVVKDLNEVLEIEHVKRFSKDKDFYGYFVSVDIEPDYKVTLMSLSDWDDEYNGCKEWWVIGFLPGFIMYETKLKKYEDFISSHKPNCWQRKYNGNKDLFGIDRPKELQLKIAKELGWKDNDLFGIAAKCDCGYDKK